MKKKLFITIGLPSSGKTTWMTNHLKDEIEKGIVTFWNIDILCEELYGDATNRENMGEVIDVYWSRYREIIESDDPKCSIIVCDNTAINDKLRRMYWSSSWLSGDSDFTLVYFDIDLIKCAERQLGRDRQVPYDVSRRLDKIMTFPSKEEFLLFGSGTRLIYVRN